MPLSGTSPATSAKPSSPIATSPWNDRFVDVAGDEGIAVGVADGVAEGVASAGDGEAEDIIPGETGEVPDPPEHPAIESAIAP
jgi:hypothetical protein